jgi:hypothetical protein
MHWLCRLVRPEHGTVINRAFPQVLDLQDLRQAIHAYGQEGTGAGISTNILEAEGAQSSYVEESGLTTGDAGAKAIAVLIGSSALSVLVLLSALAINIRI